MPILDFQAMADALLSIPEGSDLHVILRKFRVCTTASYELGNRIILKALYRSAYRFLRSDGKLLSFQGKATPSLAAALELVEMLEAREDMDFEIAVHMRGYLDTKLAEQWCNTAIETVVRKDLLADTIRCMLIHGYTVHDTIDLLHYLTAGCLARALDGLPDDALPRRESQRAIHIMHYFFSRDYNFNVNHICAIHNKLFILGLDHGATCNEYFGMLCQLYQGMPEEKMEQLLLEYSSQSGADEELKQAIRLWRSFDRREESSCD